MSIQITKHGGLPGAPPVHTRLLGCVELVRISPAKIWLFQGQNSDLDARCFLLEGPVDTPLLGQVQILDTASPKGGSESGKNLTALQ